MSTTARVTRWTAIYAVLAMAAASASGGDRLGDTHLVAGEFAGTLSCMTASCHGTPGSQSGRGFMWQQVYVHWLGTEPKYRDGRRGYDPRAEIERHMGDPHAMARQRMQEPRFQEVLRRYSTRPDGSQDAAAFNKCAGCHDPIGGGSQFHDTAVEHGIGCESCHGPAGNWLTTHYRLDTSRDELLQSGMVDTKDLLTRARVCASCHVGSKDNDMNHDMIAAGHPPLRFELAAYEALFPQKHWDDTARRRSEPDYEVQLWAAGRVASAEASLTLLESRGRRSGDDQETLERAPWPEFAESNCYACHQSMQRDEASPSGPTSNARLTVLPWERWNYSLLDHALSVQESQRQSLPPPDGMGQRVEAVRVVMERTFLPNAQDVLARVAEARNSLDRGIRNLPLAPAPDMADELLQALATAKPDTWSGLCHQFSALVAVQRSLQDQNRLPPETIGQLMELKRKIASSLGRQPAQLTKADLAAVAKDLEALRVNLLVMSGGLRSQLTSSERIP